LLVLAPLCGCEVLADPFPVGPKQTDAFAFGVTGLRGENFQPGYAEFNNTDPNVNAYHASQVCTLGYDVLDKKTLPASPGEFRYWSVRCHPYRLSL
jgi:hypothetical protein